VAAFRHRAQDRLWPRTTRLPYPMGQGTSKCIDNGAHWGWQNISGLCTSQSGLSPWLLCAVLQNATLIPLLSLAKVDGRYAQLLAQYAKVDVLLLDDWGLAPMTSEARHDLLEILDDRHDRKSTIVTSQLPVEHWHDAMGEATLADAILDRVVHNAHMIKLTGESQRKKRSKID